MQVCRPSGCDGHGRYPVSPGQTGLPKASVQALSPLHALHPPQLHSQLEVHVALRL